jgi:hypothetical protein
MTKSLWKQSFGGTNTYSNDEVLKTQFANEALGLAFGFEIKRY